MYEDAQEIHNYLPIRRIPIENNYIEHLWTAYIVLDSSDDSSRPFMVMPFHLLFMLSMQYKILRIYKEKKKGYRKIIKTIKLHDDQMSCISPSSVYQIALLSESRIIDLFKLVGLPSSQTKDIKNLIKNRNDRLAHAKGGIDPDPDGKIVQYIDLLKELQQYILPLNDNLKDSWIRDYNKEDSVDDYLDAMYLEHYFCPADLHQNEFI